jgi:hypothetical protein
LNQHNHPKKRGIRRENSKKHKQTPHFKFTCISDSLLLITYNEEEDKEDKEEDGEDEKKKRIIIE